MNIKEFAQMLDNREYDYPQFTKEEVEIAKENGFVIVCGASDDLIEFEGAIYDEGSCYDGGKVWFNKKGVIETPEGSMDNCIEAFWCNKEKLDKNGKMITWTYKTKIPHETFMIYEDKEPYCEAIIFNVDDIN